MNPASLEDYVKRYQTYRDEVEAAHHAFDHHKEQDQYIKSRLGMADPMQQQPESDNDDNDADSGEDGVYLDVSSPLFKNKTALLMMGLSERTLQAIENGFSESSSSSSSSSSLSILSIDSEISDEIYDFCLVPAFSLEEKKEETDTSESNDSLLHTCESTVNHALQRLLLGHDNDVNKDDNSINAAEVEVDVNGQESHSWHSSRVSSSSSSSSRVSSSSPLSQHEVIEVLLVFGEYKRRIRFASQANQIAEVASSLLKSIYSASPSPLLSQCIHLKQREDRNCALEEDDGGGGGGGGGGEEEDWPKMKKYCVCKRHSNYEYLERQLLTLKGKSLLDDCKPEAALVVFEELLHKYRDKMKTSHLLYWILTAHVRIRRKQNEFTLIHIPYHNQKKTLLLQKKKVSENNTQVQVGASSSVNMLPWWVVGYGAPVRAGVVVGSLVRTLERVDGFW
jgi:hypothetical protein